MSKTTVFERTRDFVPIDTEAFSLFDRDRARAWVKQHGLDLLIATDGDGDRPLLFDENGEFFPGDVLGVLTARYLGADAVVTPVSSNTVLEASGWFSHVTRTRIGSPHVIQEMKAKEGDRVVGYEANGGFLLGSDIALGEGIFFSALPTRDALLPIFETLALAKQEKKSLSGLRSLLPSRHTCSGRLTNWPWRRAHMLLEKLREDPLAFASFMRPIGGISGIDLTDGFRISVASGEIIHLRPSGNAPEFRAYVEADSQEKSEELLRFALTRVQSRPETPPYPSP